MLKLSNSLLNAPVLSLRTGTVVATTTETIINPNNLKIEGFYCQDSLERKKTRILLYQDIRDVIPQGFLVNDHDVLVEEEELVRLQDILKIGFELLGMQVVTTNKERVGKVTDFAVETSTFYIQKLYIGQSILKTLAGGHLVVDRNQIVEITDKKIIIHDLAGKVPASAGAVA